MRKKLSMSENYSIWTYIITIFAVALGWFLGEATGMIRRRREIKKFKVALVSELEDCLGWLLRNKITIENNIRIVVLHQLPDTNPVKIPTHIYDNYFTEVVTHLSKSERTSFNSIYNLINYSHEQTNQLAKLRIACINDKSRRSEFDEILEGLYHNVCLAIHLIRYHLAYGKKLDLEKMTDEEEKKILKESDDNLGKIIKEAKSLGLEGLKKKYYIK
jgi:hypothetical protein